MEDILLSQRQYFAIIKRLDEIYNGLASMKFKSNTDGDIIDNFDLASLLHISARTLYRWRTNGRLPYNKIGKKFYYRTDDIIASCLPPTVSPIENEHPPPLVLDSLADGQVITCQRCPLFEMFNS